MRSFIKSLVNFGLVIVLFTFLEWFHSGNDRNLMISAAMIILYNIYELIDKIDDLTRSE